VAHIKTFFHALDIETSQGYPPFIYRPCVVYGIEEKFAPDVMTVEI